MITSLRLKNFKNFADETLKLGPFTVIVGANASGKSNIRDAFRFLHGIGRGYTLAEAIGGKVGAGGQIEWEAIRGAPNEIVRKSGGIKDQGDEFYAKLTVITEGKGMDYSCTVGINPEAADGFRLLTEMMSVEDRQIFGLVTSEPDWHYIQEFRPALARALDRDPGSEGLRSLMCSFIEGMRFLEPMPQRMREPSIPGAISLGDYGQNLPTALEAICADDHRQRTLLSWLEELTPMDVEGFDFPRDPSGRVHLYIQERNGRKVSAYSASDGTLRFLAMLAILLDEHADGIYFFEDIDSGIHPSRLWLLIDLIERQTAKGNIQVITTTHSPALLAWMNDETFEHTSVVYRDEHWQDSVIRPIADLYDLRQLRKSKGLEWLLTSDWLDNAMHFSEGGSDTEDGEGDAEE